jgi:hypothetical protein
MARSRERRPQAGGGAHAPNSYARPAADAARGEHDESGTDDVHALALKRWQAGYERDRDNIDAAYEDLEFLEGDQWPVEAVRIRESEDRPIQTFNRMPQFVRQITGDMRLARPGIKVVPVDSGADRAIARVRAGLIRYVENRSDAQAAYCHAADQQVAAGIGHWRVIKEYADDATFNQELRVVAVEDGIAVIWDPDAILPNKEDAKWCFVPVDISRESYKERWPDHPVTDFESNAGAATGGWCGADFVRVAEYWVKKPAARTLALLPGGAIDDVTDDDARAARYRQQGIRVEERASHKVCRYLISFGAALEGPVEWPGRHIPIVRCPGEETRIGRKVKRRGIIRFAKDAQRAYNYGRSTQTEVTALQPKAPFIGTEKNFEQYDAIWSIANRKAFPYLPFTPDPNNGGVPPQRSSPAVSLAGVNETVALAAEDMKAVIGIYDAGLGARSNETSGKAILARQREGDVGSFVYQDNWSRAIRHTAVILNDLIPHVYDAERTIRILGEDGREELIRINQAAPGDGTAETERVLNDVTLGAYDVVFQPGPSYSTRREEAREGMNIFMQAAPQAAALVLDLFAEAQDWPNAEKIGKRLEHLLPAELRAREAAERGEPPEPQAAGAGQAGGPPVAAQAQAAQGAMRMQVEQQRAQAEIVEAQARVLIAQQNVRKAAIETQMKETELVKRLEVRTRNTDHAGSPRTKTPGSAGGFRR